MALAHTGHVPGKNYQDLIAWQLAMDLVEAVYRESAGIPVEKRYGLTAPMRRAAVSIPANIAEGQGRHTDGEFLNQLSVAHGSVRELETHTMIAVDSSMRQLDLTTPPNLERRAAYCLPHTAYFLTHQPAPCTPLPFSLHATI